MLICARCSERLIEAYNFGEQIKRTERDYFKWRRIDDQPKPECLVEEVFIKSEPQSNAATSIDVKHCGLQPNLTEFEASVYEEQFEVNDNENSSARSCASEFSGSALNDEPLNLLSNGKKDFQCSLCTTVFKRKINLKQHLSTVHRNSRYFSCDICTKVFFTESELKQHESLHENERAETMTAKTKPSQSRKECSTCQKTFQRYDSLLRHIELVHKERKQFQCNHCHRMFFFNSELLKHCETHESPVKRRDSKLTESTTCQKTFRGNDSLNRHFRLVHEGRKSFQCEFCPRLFFFKTDYSRHKLTHKIKEEPNEQSLACVQASTAKASNSNSFECSTCHKSFSRFASLRRHIKLVHEGRKSLQCNQCPRVFFFKTQLANHILTHSLKVKPKNPSKSRPVFKCHICFKDFPRQYKLDSHLIRSHPEMKSFQCDFCGLSFHHKTYLKDHINRKCVRRKQEKHSCRICQDAFSSSSSLRRHLQSVHQELEKQVICEFCAKPFRFLSELKQHLNFKHTINKTQQCPHCHKVLSTKSKLRHHINSVHEKLKRFTCDRCSTSFYYKQQLEIHVVEKHIQQKTRAVYDSSRPFKCSVESCSKYYKTREHLMLHLRTHSGKFTH